jgi:hypothetical protein
MIIVKIFALLVAITRTADSNCFVQNDVNAASYLPL